jgi:putative Ca2+/H+ antiporter (TMEM165/GDT1 family)
VRVATVTVHLGSVFLERAIDTGLPNLAVTAAARLAFIIFGLWTLYGDSLDKTPRLSVELALSDGYDNVLHRRTRRQEVLATITLATGSASSRGVWLGSTMAMVLADAVAIVVGMVLGKRIPVRAVKLAVAAISLATGVVTLGSLAF